MKIRKMVKKTLAAGMLSLMVCTSMSAMAEPQLIKVGNPIATANEAVVKNWAEACQAVADTQIPGVTCQDNGYNCLSFTGTVLYTGLDHATCSGKFGSDTVFNYGAGITCNDKLVGNENNFGLPFGCYDYIDCDLSLYTREAMPEACNTKPIHNSPLCEHGWTPGQPGGVICDKPGEKGEVIGTCVWDDLITKATTDAAHDYIASCVKEHEEMHFERRDNLYCREDNWRGDFKNESDRNPQECDGTITEITCMQRESPEDVCKDDADPAKCMTEIRDWLNFKRGSMLNIYCEADKPIYRYDNDGGIVDVTYNFKGAELNHQFTKPWWD